MFCLKDLGFGMRQVPTRDGSTVYQVDTPFKIAQDAPLEVYVQMLEGQIRFFDDGLNLHTLLSLGVCFEDEAKWRSLQNLFAGAETCLHPSGLIEMYAPRDRAEESFARFLLSLSQLEFWVANEAFKVKRSKKEFVARAALAFQGVFSEAQIEYSPKIQTSRREVSFDLRVDDKYVDVPFVDSVWSHVRKVGGLRIERPETRTMAVINDVADASKKAAQERDVIGVFVPAMLLSSLEASARKQAGAARVI